MAKSLRCWTRHVAVCEEPAANGGASSSAGRPGLVSVASRGQAEDPTATPRAHRSKPSLSKCRAEIQPPPWGGHAAWVPPGPPARLRSSGLLVKGRASCDGLDRLPTCVWSLVLRPRGDPLLRELALHQPRASPFPHSLSLAAAPFPADPQHSLPGLPWRLLVACLPPLPAPAHFLCSCY